MTDNLPSLSVEAGRDYFGLYYIEGAPFRIPFWTHATGIDAAEGQRRLDFANALVAAWNNRGVLDAERAKHRETLAVLQTAHDCEAAARAQIQSLQEIIKGLLEHSEPIGVVGDHFAAEARAELAKEHTA